MNRAGKRAVAADQIKDSKPVFVRFAGGRVCGITRQHERQIGNFAYGIAIHWHAAERGLERVNRGECDATDGNVMRWPDHDHVRNALRRRAEFRA
jgi:hypothetical protein